MTYCTIQDVRNLTGLSSSQISDEVISGIISCSVAQVNADIQIKWKDERIRFISNEKENLQDGSNTTFYTKEFPIGDADNNSFVSGADIYAYTLDSEGTRTQIIVTDIADSDIGKFTLASGPESSDAFFITYYSSPVDMIEPHKIINLATTQLTAALCFTNIDARKVHSFRVGKVSKVVNQEAAYKIYRGQYYETLIKVRSRIFKTERAKDFL